MAHSVEKLRSDLWLEVAWGRSWCYVVGLGNELLVYVRYLYSLAKAAKRVRGTPEAEGQ
jgi:hypothetical protein